MRIPFAAKGENPRVSGTVTRAEKMLCLTKIKCLSSEAMETQKRRQGVRTQPKTPEKPNLETGPKSKPTVA